MKLTRILAVSTLLLSGLIASTTHVTAAETPFDDNQVPIGNHPDLGSLHIMSDDTIEEAVVDPPSMLTISSATSTSGFCTSADNAVCQGNNDLWFVAHLPQCDTATTTDCIESISATTNNSQPENGTFDRYFPDQGPQSFTGKPSIQLPSGRAPSIWKIPGAPHVAGDEYAVVARLRGSTSRRKAASFQLALTPVSLKTDADTSNDYELPRWIEPGRPGGPASDRGLFRCAYWGEDGSCMLSRSFPANTSFSVTVRLAVEPSGWLHGRINDPTISFTKDGEDTVVKVTASPVQVPAFQVAKQYNEFPEAVQKAFAVDGPYGPGGSRRPQGQYKTDPAERNAEYAIVSYEDKAFEQLELMTPVIEDKAGWAPYMWRVRTLSDDEMNKAGKCLTSGDGVKGIVTTNATVYGSGPPAFNTETKSLDYKVAAPHYTRTGEEFQGAYHLIMRSSVARCFYNFTPASVKAEISVIKSEGKSAAVTTSVKESGGWLRLSATGFTHSAPVVRAVLSQDPEPATVAEPAPTAEPAAAAPAVTAPVVTAPVVTAPVVVKAKGLTTAAKKTVTNKSLAKAAGIAVPKNSKITLSMSKKYAKQCKLSKTSVRTLKKGKCVVKVTVATTVKKKTKKTSKNVTITVR